VYLLTACNAGRLAANSESGGDDVTELLTCFDASDSSAYSCNSWSLHCVTFRAVKRLTF